MRMVLERVVGWGSWVGLGSDGGWKYTVRTARQMGSSGLFTFSAQLDETTDFA